MAHDSEETMWSQYEDMGLLGFGGCSIVRSGRHRLTGVSVAIKILEKADKKFSKLESEVDILKMADHPNIVTLFQIVETPENLYLVLELCDKPLYKHVQEAGGYLEEDEARRIFLQILEAVRFCHNSGIAHQDIKPDNVMLNATGQVMLIDFGLATTFRPGEKFTRRCGCFTYTPPPEIYKHQPYDARKKDMWTLGILLYDMVTGTVPFKSKVLWELKEKILEGEYWVPPYLSEELTELMSFLITVDPDLRSPVSQLMTHVWLQQGREGSRLPIEPPSRRLDPDILAAMSSMGLDTCATRESVLERKFDQLMATYLLIKYHRAQSSQEGTGTDKPVFPGTTPFPTFADPAAFPLHQKRRQTVAVLQAGSSLLRVQESEDGQQPEQKPRRGVSLPNMPLSCPQTMPPVSPNLKNLRPMTAPGTLFPSYIFKVPESMAGSQIPEAMSASVYSRGTYGPGGRLKLSEITGSPPISEERPAASSSQGPSGQGSSMLYPERTSSSDGTEEAAVASSSWGPCQQASSLQHPEGTSSNNGTEEPAASSSRGPQGPGRPAAPHRGLRLWKICRRIENCVRTLCSCLRTSHRNRVAPAQMTVPKHNLEESHQQQPRSP